MPNIISIDKDTLELFNTFYHNTSYAGCLKIRLFDEIVFGGQHSVLSLVMEKDIGKFGTSVNNSYYKFYLEFSNRVVNSRHPILKYMYFNNFGELYEPAFNEETLSDLIVHNIDKNIFQTFSQEFFQTDIEIVVKLPENKKDNNLSSEYAQSNDFAEEIFFPKNTETKSTIIGKEFWNKNIGSDTKTTIYK